MKAKLTWRKMKSGEHCGFWCVSYRGLGAYGLNKSDAIRNLKEILLRAKKIRFV